MGWYLIFVTCFFSFPIARTTILVGPKSAVYPEGSNVTLQCLAERRNIIVWEAVNDNTVIFIDKEKNTRKEKFDNFVISNGEDNFSLTIVNAQLSDEGFYACEEGDESRSANVTIEAGPDLSILVNNTLLVPENRTTITEDEQVFVMCKAEGAKPAVHLKLKMGENEWIESNNTITNEGLHFTTETRVVHRVTRADTTVTCQATGQVSIPPSTTMSSMNVLHKPTCVIELGTDLAECQCVSNPAVSTYSWYVNGELQSTDPSLRIHEYILANITCLASNEVGISPLTSRYVSLPDLQGDSSARNVAIIIAAIFVCVIVIGILLIIVYKQSKHACKNLKDKEDGGSDVDAENKELFIDGNDTIAQTARENIHLGTSNGGKAIDDGNDTIAQTARENIHLETSNGGKAIDETQDSDLHNTDKHTPLNRNEESEDTFYDTVETLAGDAEETIPLRANTREKENEDNHTETLSTDLGLMQLFSDISTVIPHDWEIFAIEDLKLETETVKEIIRKYPEMPDQLRAALELWVTSCPDASKSYLEKNILPSSEVHGYYRQQLHRGENSKSSEQFLQDATFSNLLKEVVKCVGHFGAQRLVRKYREQNVDTSTDSQIATLTGQSFLNLLQKENLWTDDMESLSRWKKALDDSLLLRASHLVEAYINKKEKLKKNLSSTETVL